MSLRILMKMICLHEIKVLYKAYVGKGWEIITVLPSCEEHNNSMMQELVCICASHRRRTA